MLERLAASLGLPGAPLDQVQAHLARVSTPLWLVLDDLPRCSDGQLDTLLNGLLLHSCESVSWWVASRHRPAWQLPRLLLEGELHELGARDLALTSDELTQLLEQDNATWSAEQSNELLLQTCGWYAGVRLSLMGGSTFTADEVPNEDSLIWNYLERELLGQLPDEWGQALCLLSCLPDFDAELCEHVLEGGGSTLRALRDAGAFIESLDGQPGAFRVQPNVARILSSQLLEHAKPALYRRVCQFYCAQERLHEAIDYAVLAEQPDMAASLLQRWTPDQLLQGQGLKLMQRWRSQLPADLISSTPRLLMLNAWSLVLGARLDDAERCIEQLRQLSARSSSEEQVQTQGERQVLMGMIACHRGDTELGACLLGQGLAALPEQAWSQRVLGMSALIELACAEGRVEEVRRLRRAALKLTRVHDSSTLEGLLTLQHAHMLTNRGELDRAHSQLRHLHRELLVTQGKRSSHLSARLQLHLGNVHRLTGQTAQAIACFEAGISQCRECGDIAASWGYAGLAELDATGGDVARAHAHLLEAERMMQKYRAAEATYLGRLNRVMSDLWIRDGQHQRALDLALHWRQHAQAYGLGPLAFDDGEMSVRLELMEIRARQGMGEDLANRLHALLKNALVEERLLLACELWVDLAQAHHERGRQRKAQSALLDGLALARRVGMPGITHFCRASSPVLSGWAGKVGEQLDKGEEDNLDVVPLSRRELSVLRLIAGGLANQEIAQSLHISLHTVKSHAQKINTKLGVSRRTQAIVRAKELGIVA